MNRWETFEAFFTNPHIDISLGAFAMNLVLAALLAWLLGQVYVRFARTLSNRQEFARNFVLITTTTTLIISIVKSSLALSLGLVGALSIVRFRAAIKEPEELAYLFLAIAVGLGLGADQRVVTLVAFAGIVGFLAMAHATRSSGSAPNLFLTVASPGSDAGLDAVVEVLKAHCTDVNLRRLEEDGEGFEAAFVVDYESFDQMNASRDALRALHDGIRVSFLDGRGVA